MCLPESASLQAYRHAVQAFPDDEPAELLGLHPEATRGCREAQAQTFMDHLVALQSRMRQPSLMIRYGAPPCTPLAKCWQGLSKGPLGEIRYGTWRRQHLKMQNLNSPNDTEASVHTHAHSHTCAYTCTLMHTHTRTHTHNYHACSGYSGGLW